MRSILALVRVQWLTHASYRMNVVFSMLGLVATFVPIYLVAGALQPVVADSIADEGGAYFGFLIARMAVMQVIDVTVRGLPTSLSSAIGSGTLEALFATPTPLPHLLAGLVGYMLIWSAIKAGLLLVAFALVGGGLAVQGIPMACVILALLILAHVPIGLVAGSMILVFRTAGPIVPGALATIALLGGVYYSTSVIPEVLRPLSAFVPLTYGLRAFRRTLLSGAPFSAVAGDVAILLAFTVILLAGSLLLFRWSLGFAQKAGSLAQY